MVVSHKIETQNLKYKRMRPQKKKKILKEKIVPDRFTGFCPGLKRPSIHNDDKVTL